MKTTIKKTVRWYGKVQNWKYDVNSCGMKKIWCDMKFPKNEDLAIIAAVLTAEAFNNNGMKEYKDYKKYKNIEDTLTYYVDFKNSEAPTGVDRDGICVYTEMYSGGFARTIPKTENQFDMSRGEDY